jgi:ribosomal protein S6 kinase alpha-5
VKINHSDVLGVLGAGTFGKVFLVRKMGGDDSGHLYALKELTKTGISQNSKLVEYVTTEREVLGSVRGSPFFVRMQYAFQSNEKLHLILDYASGCDLFTHFYRQDKFTEVEAHLSYIGEVILAIGHLHKLGVIYRDLKPENILIDGEGHIVLTDFGLCKKFLSHETPRAYSYCGTLDYKPRKWFEQVPPAIWSCYSRGKQPSGSLRCGRRWHFRKSALSTDKLKLKAADW